MFVAALGALAYWTTSGTGTASASAGTLIAASISAPGTSTGTVTITWDTQAAMTPASQNSSITYTVERKLDAGVYAAVGTGPCSSPLPHGTASCTDTVGASGTYTYRVVAHFSTAWTAVSNEVTVTANLDNTPPTVSSITTDDANPTNASSVHWTVTFSEDVTGVDAADFALVGAGSSGASITSVIGSNSSYTATVSTGADGTLGLNLVDDDSIQDLGANQLGGAGAGNGNFTGDTYTVDRTAPSVSSITRDDVSPTNAGTVAWTVTFSETVSGVDMSDFALTASGLNGSPAVQSVTSLTAATYTVTATTGTGTPSGSGTLRLDVTDDDSIEDTLGNKLGGTGAGNGDFTTGQAYTIDKTPPTVLSINRQSGAQNPTNATSLAFTVTFSEPVSNVVAARFAVTTANVTGTAPSVDTVTPSGAAPTATWTVTVSTSGAVGANNGSVRLDLTSIGTIQDVATNLLAATRDGDQAYTYDTTQPTVSSINRAGASATVNSGPLTWTVTFSEPVNGVITSNFALATSGLGGTAPSITSATATGGAPSATWTVSVSTSGTTGTNAGSIGLNLANTTNIKDVATNDLGATTPVVGQAYTYDTTQPTVSSINRAGASATVNSGPLTWTVTFSEPVNNVAPGNFSLATANIGGSAPSVTSATPTGSAPATAWTISVSTAGTSGANSGSIRLDLSSIGTITDAATNLLAATFNSGQAYTYDTTAPSVTSINRHDASPTNASAVQFDITFSESVSGVDAGDFTIAASSVTGTSKGTFAGSGSSYTLIVTTGTGSGTIGLNLTDDDSISDTATNKLGGTGAGNGNFTGQVYTIDKTAPALSTLEMFDVNANGKVDRVIATFNETLAACAAPCTTGWMLANVPSGGTLGSVTIAGSAATLTITEGAGAADTAVASFTIVLAASSEITDTLGNHSAFSATPPTDKAAPVPVALVDAGGIDGRFEAADTMTITFSENVTGVAATSNVALISGNGSNNDTLTMSNFLSGTATLPKPTTDYISGNNNTANFNGSALSQPTSSQVRITLAACTGNCAQVTTVSAAGNFTYTPSSAITDAAGNIAVGSITVSIRVF